MRSRAGYKSGVFQVLTRSDVREILVLNRESEGHIPAWPSDDTLRHLDS